MMSTQPRLSSGHWALRAVRGRVGPRTILRLILNVVRWRRKKIAEQSIHILRSDDVQHRARRDISPSELPLPQINNFGFKPNFKFCQHLSFYMFNNLVNITGFGLTFINNKVSMFFADLGIADAKTF